MGAKILVADDESKIRMLISEFLSDEGYEVVQASDGLQALAAFERHKDINLIILDVMMPHLDGWSVCKKIKQTSDIPIIMLTAKSAESDEIESFQKGADDYISKPFSLSVLLARVKARLASKERNENEKEIIERDKLILNKQTHEVTLDGKEIHLTPIEYELLRLLAEGGGKVFSREKLLADVWGYDYYGGDRTVDTHIGRLRIKLGKFGQKYIKTIRGYGYKFEI